MKTLLLLLALGSAPAYARTYFVYEGRVALGRRFGVHQVSGVGDLNYSRLHPTTARAAEGLGRLRPHAVYICHMVGHVELVGVRARPSAIISRFRVHRVTGCRAAQTREMLAAHQT